MLETERLQMRLWRPSDAERIRGLWTERDPRSLHVIDADGRPTLNDLRAAIQTQLVATARTGLALLAIDTRIKRAFIGYCGLIEGRATIDEPEIAFELFRRARGKGTQPKQARPSSQQRPKLEGLDCGGPSERGTSPRCEYSTSSDSSGAERSRPTSTEVTCSGSRAPWLLPTLPHPSADRSASRTPSRRSVNGRVAMFEIA
jgi:hypothetical protein